MRRSSWIQIQHDAGNRHDSKSEVSTGNDFTNLQSKLISGGQSKTNLVSKLFPSNNINLELRKHLVKICVEYIPLLK